MNLQQTGTRHADKRANSNIDISRSPLTTIKTVSIPRYMAELP